MKFTNKQMLIALLIVAAVAIPFTLAKGGDGEGCAWKGDYGKYAMFADLTEEQQAELKELKSSDASKEEIKELLESFGIEVDESKWTKHKKFGSWTEHKKSFYGKHAMFKDLTEEQREELMAIKMQLKEEGASHEEIKEAMQEFFADLEA